MEKGNRTPTPPSWADRLLEWFCAPHLQEEVQGDLHELYGKWVEKHGVRKARWLYIIHSLKFFRPYAFKKVSIHNPTDMLKNYFIIAFRNLVRQKVFSFINVIGLTVGMAVFMIVIIFINYEQQYDRFHHKNIYRLIGLQKQDTNAGAKKVAQTIFPLGSALKDQFPQIKDFVRIISWERVPLRQKDKSVVMGKLLGTDASFLQVFQFGLLKGDPATALQNPHSIVLTAELAQQIFGTTEALGQTVRHEGRDTVDYVVTGIVVNVPAQSHLQFDALYALTTEETPDWMSDWDTDWMYTYVELQDNVDADALQPMLISFLKNHSDPSKVAQDQLILQPLRDVHLHSVDITNDILNTQKFDGKYIPLLMAIAAFVLLLGIINYINLSTARSFTRTKEIGLRKSMGAKWEHITLQLLLETFIFSLGAMIAALLLVQLLLPVINKITLSNLQFAPEKEPWWLPLALMVASVTAVMAGLLPALSLARIRPFILLKGHITTGGHSPVRNILVIVQFTIAIGLTIVTFTVLRQLNFIRHYDLGFNKEAVIVIPVSYSDRQREESLMHSIHNITGVKDVTGSLRRLGNLIDQNTIVFQDESTPYEYNVSILYADYNYIPFYDIEVIAGRNLSPDYGNDREGNTYILNETLAKQLLAHTPQPDTTLESLVGKSLRYGYEDSSGTIIGIVKDFNFGSLHQKIEPLCISYQDEYYFTDISVRLNDRLNSQTISSIEQVWQDLLPNQDFQYTFLDKHLEALYNSDEQSGRLISIFTVTDFIISCIGLIGITAFNIERRTKEIGIRKVLGATVRSIVALLSKDFLKLILISIIVAVPITWWAIQKWLENFAFRIDMDGWMFVIAAVSAMLVALITISFQSIKAAIANPVDSLRNE